MELGIHPGACSRLPTQLSAETCRSGRSLLAFDSVVATDMALLGSLRWALAFGNLALRSHKISSCQEVCRVPLPSSGLSR